MSKKFKISVIGFMEDLNIGDCAIVDNCDYLIKDICSKNDIDAEISKFPMFPTKTKNKILKFVKRQCRVNHSNFHKLFVYFIFLLYSFFPFNVYKKYYEKIIKNSDLVVIAGGGLLKYYTQHFWSANYHIIKNCEKYDVPIYYNAVGIEGFDLNNFYCKLLNDLLQSKCIKKITTRDDYVSLEKFRPDIKGEDSVVGDPALWSNVFYPRNIQKNGLIGIGVIRHGIFTANDKNITENDLLDFYIGIIKRLQNDGFQWQLFTNGLQCDYDLGLKILDRLGIEPNAKIIADNPKTTEELIDLIIKYDGVVANRMHAHILAISYGIPVVGLIWNPKLMWFAKHSHLTDNFFEVSQIKDLDSIYGAFIKSMQQKDIYNQIQVLKTKTYTNLENFILNLFKKG